MVPGEVRDLIRRMAAENQWRAPRIHGELLRLGFNVSERTVSRYLRGLPSRPHNGQNWRTFVKNHREVIAAMDFFTVPTASVCLLYMLFVIRHGRRDIVHWNITEHPSARWVIQQLREAFPYDSASRYLVFDRDAIFSAQVATAVRSMNIEPTRTYQSPWQNGVAERLSAPCAVSCSTTSSCSTIGTSVAFSASTSGTTSRTARISGSTRMRLGLVPSSRAQRGRRLCTPDRGSVGSTIAIAGARPRRPSPATDRQVPAARRPRGPAVDP